MSTSLDVSRLKTIRILIEKAPEYKTYVTPIAVAAVGMLGVILIRYDQKD